jgi:hypothetical protein
MNWMSWKTWTVIATIVVAVFAIYTFAANQPSPDPVEQAIERPNAGRNVVRTPGVEPVHMEWLEAQSGSYSSRRNIFAFPAPAPPPLPPPPPPPPDKDKDGVPDFRDNCVSTANPDQSDVDRDGIGTACDEPEVAPPPPPPPKPVPPAFPFKYIGTFGSAANPIATFSRDGEIVNARVGTIIDGRFILRRIGIESVEIGFVGFPQDEVQRIPIGQ